MSQVAALVATIVMSFMFSGTITWLVRRYAVQAGILDKATERSSHVGDIPRGGGLAIVLTVVAVLAALWASNAFSHQQVPLELMLATGLLALIGWLDDLRVLATWHKFATLFLVSAVIVWIVGPVGRIEFAGYVVETGIFAPIVTVIWIFGLANSYNFMDGIDGLAAGQGAIAGCAFGVWFTVVGAHALALFCYALMAACMGFLLWNWSPARIFMGDTGSLTLGGVFAVLSVIAYKHHGFPIGAAALLFGVFLADTLVTFFRRAIAGKRVWNAHREHYYQRAVQTGLSHPQVTIGLLLGGVGLMLLATLEVMRVDPRYLWYFIALSALFALGMFVSRRERQQATTA